MAKLYKVKENSLEQLEPKSFKDENIYEVKHLQKMITGKIEVLGDDIMVIAKEFQNWEESNRSIDILAVDKKANLVVIELKRTNDDAHMELQAIRYAAMISTMTWKNAVDAFSNYIKAQSLNIEAQDELCKFLGWDIDSPKVEDFAQKVRVILAAADFSKEITTSVLWLNDRDLDITCVRLSLHKLADQLVLSAEQIIPLPEAAEYQIKVKEKRHEERVFQKDVRDRSLYTILYDDDPYEEPFKKADIGYYTVRLLSSKGLINDEVFTFLRNDMSCGFSLLKLKEEMTDVEKRYSKYRQRSDPELKYGGKDYFVARNWERHNIGSFIKKIEGKFSAIKFARLEEPGEDNHRSEISALNIT